MIGAIALLVRAQLARRRNGPSIHTPQAVPTHDTLQALAELMAAGTIRAQIERTFDFTDAAAALQHLETEHARAKVVVTYQR